MHKYPKVSRALKNFFWVLFFCQEVLALQQKGLSRQESIEVFRENENYAVIVGIDQYDNINPLNYAVKDAERLSKFFKDQGYAVISLTNYAADNLRILERLKTVVDIAAKSTGKRGNIIFAFSGHGFSDKENNYLATPRTNPNDLANTAIPVKDIKSLLESAHVRQRVMFIDACRNDPGKSISMARQTFQADNDAEGLGILYGTGPGGVSYEDAELEQGVFSHFLLVGLLGGAVTHEGLITFDSLHKSVVNKVKRHVLKRFQKTQVPYISGERSGDFIVAWGPDGQPVDSEIELVHNMDYEQLRSNQAFIVTARVTHINPIKEVSLFYRIKGELDYSKTELHDGLKSGNYMVEIPASKISAPGLEYYLEVKDNKGNLGRKGSHQEPLRVAVMSVLPGSTGSGEKPIITTSPTEKWLWVIGIGAVGALIAANSNGESSSGGSNGDSEKGHVTILVPDP